MEPGRRSQSQDVAAKVGPAGVKLALETAQPLLGLASALRFGEHPLGAFLDALESRFAQAEPYVQAFVPEEDRFGRLRREAELLEGRYPEPLSRPPLFGVPIGIKDIFRAEGFPTTAGSKLPPDVLRGREARSVTILKQAGALILGKTVTTEFAYFGPGPTRNPHDLRHTPGGSSSGSAAAVAAGLSPLATGSQTIGSICRPAAFCGVVGFKPTYDRISRDGVIPLAPSLDHIGVLASDVAGADLAASLLCPDWQIAVTDRLPVLGVPDGPFLERATEVGRTHFAEVCDRLRAAGCTLIPVPVFADLTEIEQRHQLILAAEAAQVHAAWYAEFGELYHPRTRALIDQGRDVSVAQIAEALNGRQRLRRQLSFLSDEYGIDAWISPAAPGPAPAGLESTGNPIMNLPWTHSGLPTIALPAGFSTEGLPLGIQLAGRWYEDEALTEWAAAIEPIVRPDGGNGAASA
jgi:Asp-tRNA(Asn)/Glu-tRNA(Gln) amidotransferase A subunit family amidase